MEVMPEKVISGGITNKRKSVPNKIKKPEIFTSSRYLVKLGKNFERDNFYRDNFTEKI